MRAAKTGFEVAFAPIIRRLEDTRTEMWVLIIRGQLHDIPEACERAARILGEIAELAGKKNLTASKKISEFGSETPLDTQRSTHVE